MKEFLCLKKKKKSEQIKWNEMNNNDMENHTENTVANRRSTCLNCLHDRICTQAI